MITAIFGQDDTFRFLSTRVVQKENLEITITDIPTIVGDTYNFTFTSYAPNPAETTNDSRQWEDPAFLIQGSSGSFVADAVNSNVTITIPITDDVRYNVGQSFSFIFDVLLVL